MNSEHEDGEIELYNMEVIEMTPDLDKNNPETESFLDGQKIFKGPRIIPKIRRWFKQNYEENE